MQEPTEKVRNILYPEIAAELTRMVEEDQKELMEEGSFNEKSRQKRTGRIKEIFSEVGLLTTSKVGVEGTRNAWLLVQHADCDIPFQEEYLKLLQSAPQDQVIKRNLAYLEDRVRKNSGKPQLYGTQIIGIENGVGIPYPVEDPKNLASRRKDMGLEPFEKYIENMIKGLQSTSQK